MFLSSQRLSDGEVCEKLGENLALEYIRDSPLFRQQLNAFEESCIGLSGYTQGIMSALSEVDSAIVTLQKAQTKLATRLTGREGGYSRCLFTNAFPKLGLLTNTLHEVADAFEASNNNLDNFRQSLRRELSVLVNDLTDPITSEESSKKNMERLYDTFESKLIGTLSSRTPPSAEKVNEMCELRVQCELTRFDLVARLNRENCKKKYILTKVACAVINTMDNFFTAGRSIIEEKRVVLGPIEEALPAAAVDLNSQDMLWGRVRARLQGELMGAMPAPGSPPGALSPIQPRTHQGMPVYSATISTEVLSSSTRKATFNDVRHAADEGVFKQGYLCVKTGYFGTKKRKWHRLYATTLYLTDIAAGQPSCSMEPVCDIKDCSVTVKPGDQPYTFIIGTSDGTRLEFQAESEDEMVLWITAIRRCSVSAPGRHTTAVGRRQMLESSTDDNIGEGEVPLLLPPESPQDGPGKKLLREFVTANRTCAECNSGPVTWLSTSLGITLCQQCAAVHRQLSWAISKLKSIELDEFSEWQMKIIHYELGNDVVNSIWEKNVPAGWTKPSKGSSPEDRSKWILAKYRWYAFVDEVRVTSDQELIEVR